MIEERFTHSERQRLISLVLAAFPSDHGDVELTAILTKLSGVDTVIIAQRAYPSRKIVEDRTAETAKKVAALRRERERGRR
jgi:hypothetical protein